jgi:hypothetical protein
MPFSFCSSWATLKAFLSLGRMASCILCLQMLLEAGTFRVGVALLRSSFKSKWFKPAESMEVEKVMIFCWSVFVYKS